MWKSKGWILQSCYKRTLTTFCTRERRTQKAFRMNVLSLIQLHSSTFLDQHLSLSTNCGTTQNKYELLASNIRRTLFRVLRAIEISKQNRMSDTALFDNSDTKANLIIFMMRSRILSRVSCLRFQKVMLKTESIDKISELIFI